MSSTSAQGKIFDAKILKRILKQVRPYRGKFILTGVLVIALAAIVWVRPWLIGRAVDQEIANGDVEGLLRVFLMVIGLLMIEALLQFYQTYWANWVAQSVTLDLRSKLYEHVLRFKLRYFDRTPVGTFVTRLVSDIDGIADVFSNGILSVIGDLLKLTVVIIVMFSISWKLTLIILIPIPILLIATRIFQKAIKKAFIKVRNEVSRINVFVQEHVTGMSIVQLFHREVREKEKFEAINKEHKKANIASIWAFSIFFPIVELLSAGSIALLLWFGVQGVIDESITLGDILSIILFVFMLYRPIRQLADRFNVLQMGIVNSERVFKLFDSQEFISDEGKRTDVNFTGSIEFKNIWFAYKDEDWVLKDVSFEVKEGETVAFVGATGAGKSSVINLLSRFYEYQKGSIHVDGTDLKDIQLKAVRENIAVVLQDVFLFSDSIHNNVTLYNKDITREKVIEAAKAVGAHGFISKLPGDYDYDVRERGGMLSVGQRQLLAFMRAYLYEPKILVLDEATSSVDTESEELIQEATIKLTKGRTSIVIAHRLSTIQNADRIIVMDKGRILESGKHQELLQNDGAYKRLYELQFDEDKA
ncbi:MAG: ABC transporter ATP-binding protein [Bacteroidetes bacterium]|nr:ABC transporter ATP-binding protein [Bacteroidota bacterium]